MLKTNQTQIEQAKIHDGRTIVLAADDDNMVITLSSWYQDGTKCCDEQLYAGPRQIMYLGGFRESVTIGIYTETDIKVLRKFGYEDVEKQINALVDVRYAAHKLGIYTVSKF